MFVPNSCRNSLQSCWVWTCSRFPAAALFPAERLPSQTGPLPWTSLWLQLVPATCSSFLPPLGDMALQWDVWQGRAASASYRLSSLKVPTSSFPHSYPRVRMSVLSRCPRSNTATGWYVSSGEVKITLKVLDWGFSRGALRFLWYQS